MSSINIFLIVLGVVILLGLIVAGVWFVSRHRSRGGTSEEKFEYFKNAGRDMKIEENTYIKKHPNEPVPKDESVNPGTWWQINSKDLDNEPIGQWSIQSKEIIRNDKAGYCDPRIFSEDKKKRDDFNTDGTPLNHFINQLIRIPHEKPLTEKTLMQIAYNIGQGSVDGQVKESYPMSFFISK